MKADGVRVHAEPVGDLDAAHRRGRHPEQPQHVGSPIPLPRAVRARRCHAAHDDQAPGAAARCGRPATSGVSTPSGPNLAAPPGEPNGTSRPGSVSAKNASLSA